MKILLTPAKLIRIGVTGVKNTKVLTQGVNSYKANKPKGFRCLNLKNVNKKTGNKKKVLTFF